MPSASPGLDRDLLRLASVVVLGTIMSILDTTIVNVAIETLGRELHSSLSAIQWVSTGYLLALATVIPLTGWAMERFGGKRMWMISVTLFMAGSALCGLSWSVESLIVFRVLQGFGGGMILPIGQAILAQAAGPQRMGRVMSVIGVPTLLGPVLGPVIGGLIVDHFSWRWIFFVNLPVGAVALLMAWRILPAADVRRSRPALDLRGLLLLSPGLAALVYGLSEFGIKGGLDHWSVLVGIVAGAVLLVGFVVHARRIGAGALIDLRLFQDRAFSAASGTVLVFGISLFGAMFVLPLYYQVVRGQSALDAGLLLAPQGLGAATAMPIAGRLTDTRGAGPDRAVRRGDRRDRDVHLHAAHGAHELRAARSVALRARRGAGDDDDARDGRRLPDAGARRGAPRDQLDQHHPHDRRLARHSDPVRRPRAPDRRPVLRRRLGGLRHRIARPPQRRAASARLRKPARPRVRQHVLVGRRPHRSRALPGAAAPAPPRDVPPRPGTRAGGSVKSWLDVKTDAG
jgi:MFS family permease